MATELEKSTALIDSYLKMVGTLVNNAALCDLVLFSAFKIITSCESNIAHAIYFSSETLQAKRGFIFRVLVANNDPIEKEIVERIIQAVEKAQNQRNELGHAVMQVTADGTTLLGLNARRQAQSQKTITGAYLDALLKHSSQALLGAQKAFQELCSKRGIPPAITHE